MVCFNEDSLLLQEGVADIKEVCTQFVDETAELAKFYGDDPHAHSHAAERADLASPASSAGIISTGVATGRTIGLSAQEPVYVTPSPGPPVEQRAYWDSVLGSTNTSPDQGPLAAVEHAINVSGKFPQYDVASTSSDRPNTVYCSPPDAGTSSIPGLGSHQIQVESQTRRNTHPASVLEDSARRRSWSDLTTQEACLVRYFVDSLACWVSKLIFSDVAICTFSHITCLPV